MDISELERIAGRTRAWAESFIPSDALEAVKQDGDALRYVKEQTEAICLEAVKQDGYALRFVDFSIFNSEVQ